jgi:hypothetical protein
VLKLPNQVIAAIAAMQQVSSKFGRSTKKGPGRFHRRTERKVKTKTPRFGMLR